MQFAKIVFAFVAVGGATYALFQVVPPWVKFVSIVFAIVSVILALPELPKALDALEVSAKKIAAWIAAIPTPPPPNPNLITFNIRNSSSSDIHVAYFSQTRPGHRWPDIGRAYVVPRTVLFSDSMTLACQRGEQICYGAWPAQTDGRSRHWGLGNNTTTGCSDCCGYCGPNATYSFNLGD